MLSQFPALKSKLVREMEGHQERIAKAIRKEAARTGEDPMDLAQAMGVHVSTVERWFRAERMPQKRHRRELAKHWDLPLDAFEFDLEAEDEEVREQLNRMEAMLALLLEQAGLELPTSAGDGATSIDQLGGEALDDLEGRGEDAGERHGGIPGG